MSDIDSTENQISQVTSSSKQNSDSNSNTNGNNDVSSSMSEGVPSSFTTNQNAFTSPRTTVSEQQPKPPILAPSKFGGVGTSHTPSSSVLAPSRLFGSSSSSASSSNQFGLGKTSNCTSSSTPFNSSKFTLKPSVLGVSSSASNNPFLKAPAKEFDLDDNISKSSDTFKKKEEQDNKSGSCSLFQPSKEKISSSTTNGDNENGTEKTSDKADTGASEDSKSCEAASSSPNNVVSLAESSAPKTDSTSTESLSSSSKPVESSASNGATGFSFCSSSTGSNLTKPLQSNFVFGQNLLSRVADSEGISSSADKEEGKKSEEGGLFSAAASLFSVAANAISVDKPSSSNGKSLETSSRELAEKESREKRKFDEVEVITGEETESNVLQMNCRVYMWLKGGWVERGRGILRLNDWGSGGVEMNSRLVIRTQGTLTIMLNTKIWHEMNVEKASGKGVRFTAVDPDGQLKVYLVMGSAKEIEMLFTSLEWRVANIRRREKTEATAPKKAKQEE